MNARDAPDRDAASDQRQATADGEAKAVRDAIRAVRRDGCDSFAHIVQLYQQRLFGLALMITRDPSAAEEVAQDAFVRAFTHLDAYDPNRPFYPWLATIAVRLAQNWLSQRARAAAREAAAPGQDLESTATADPLAALIADEHSRWLWRVVAALPAGERAAVILYYQQEMSVRDIAHALGVTGGTVKTLLFRARQRLRRSAGGREKEAG